MDNISVLCWNVRGLNDRARRDTVRTLVDDMRPAIVCLQETKLNVISEFVVFGMLWVNFREFAYLPASDTRGGILVTVTAGSRTLPSLMYTWAAFLSRSESGY
jgi:exonuclease III